MPTILETITGYAATLHVLENGNVVVVTPRKAFVFSSTDVETAEVIADITVPSDPLAA